MSILRSFRVHYEVVLPTGAPGAKYKYRKGTQIAHVGAANSAGVAAVLASNVTLVGSEAIEILGIQEIANDVGLLV
jgi:hypothetical protein